MCSRLISPKWQGRRVGITAVSHKVISTLLREVAEQLWYYGALVEAFKQTTAPNVIVSELERVVKELRAEGE